MADPQQDFTSPLGATHTAAELVPVIEQLFNKFILPRASALDPTDTGGWFTVWRAVSPGQSHAFEPVLGVKIGTITGTNPLKTLMRVANEKAARLAFYPFHLSSWESRDLSNNDPAQHKYGGAIRVPYNEIWSFAGLAEHYDEALLLLAARILRPWHPDQILRIVERSDNAPYRELIADPVIANLKPSDFALAA